MNAYPFAVVTPEQLADVAGAYEHWRESVERERAARVVFRAAVSTARDNGAKLDEIAAQLGVTRQAIQKVLREVRREAEEVQAAGQWLERRADRELREQRQGIGRARCGHCNRFKPRPSGICDYCGDEPGTYNGDPRDYDAAVYGQRVL